jgi:hypothetical protein
MKILSKLDTAYHVPATETGSSVNLCTIRWKGFVGYVTEIDPEQGSTSSITPGKTPLTSG